MYEKILMEIAACEIPLLFSTSSTLMLLVYSAVAQHSCQPLEPSATLERETLFGMVEERERSEESASPSPRSARQDVLRVHQKGPGREPPTGLY